MAWSLGNKASGRDGASPGTNTYTLTITSSTSGRLLVAHILLFDAANRTITGVAGNTGGAWTQHFQNPVVSGPFAGICVATFYLDNCPSGVTSVTVTCSGATQFKEIACYELVTNGVAVATDGVVTNNNKAAVGTAYTGEALTTTGAGAGAAFGFYWDVNATQNPKTGNEFNAGGEQFSSGSDAVCLLLNPTSAAHTPEWVGGSGGSGGTFTVAFKDSGGSSSPFLGTTPDTPQGRTVTQPIVTQSLLQTTLAPAAAASPFVGRAFPNPQSARRSRELLTWTSGFVIDDAAPFMPPVWTNPRPAARRQSWVSANLLQTTLGQSAIVGSATITLSALTSSSTGTVAVAGASAVTLGAVTSSAVGTVAVAGSASVTLGPVTLTANGVVGSTPIEGQAAFTLGSATASAAGVVAVTGTSAFTLGTVTLSATGTVSGGVTGDASVTLSAATVSAAGAVAVTGTAAITLGALSSATSGTTPGVSLQGRYVTGVDLIGRWE